MILSLDTFFMRRALDLAANGFPTAFPNPMVGCVIVAQDNKTVIGEGWHRQCGKGHAEVNAFASVRASNRHLLSCSTMYVTLEPCSHWGRTPPCASLIIDKKIKRVVVASVDPFEKVCGRGIKMLREAGIEVETGVLNDEAQKLNAFFFTANGPMHRPFITLKWAQSADGNMDWERTPQHSSPCRFSSALTTVETHRLRAAHQAILVGSGTVLADHPRLNLRNWPGISPLPVILDRRNRISAELFNLSNDALILKDFTDLQSAITKLHEQGVRSVLVEGGSSVLNAFVSANLWDAARVETSSLILGKQGCAKAPSLPSIPIKTIATTSSTLRWYSNNPLFTASHPMCL